MDGSADVLESLGHGKRVLCVGPPMAGKREFLLDIVRGVPSLGREVLVVTTDASASTLLDRYPAAFDPGHTGIVDCTGTALPDGDVVLESVTSPVDLTGIGVAVSKALDRIGGRTGGLHRPLVALDSLTTLSLYAEFDRLFRFLHSFGGRVVGCDGLFLVTLDSDGLDPQSTARIRSTADECVEFRSRTEYRLVGPGDDSRDRVRPAPNGSGGAGSGSDDPDGGSKRASRTGGSDAVQGNDRSQTGSLAPFIERTLADGPTLTLCNVDDGTDTEVIESHFGRLNVSVRRASLDVGTPREVGLLHDGPDLLAASSLPAISAALDAVDPEEATPQVLEAVPQQVFVADRADRRTLVRASRTIERLAAGGSGGVLHAGFQRLSNLLDDPEARAVYEHLDGTSASVHLYGAVDADLPDWEGVTSHGLPYSELADAWFVVYQAPDGDTNRGGALVTLEGEPGHYDGFWSYDPEVVAATRSFVESTYLG